jgi:hypothetical protein
MNTIRRASIAIAMFALYGCTGQVALLKNEKGELARCEVTQGEAMWSGVIVRDMTLQNCVSAYEKAGYKRLQ